MLTKCERVQSEIIYPTQNCQAGAIAAPGGQLMAAEVASRNGTLEVGRVQKLFDVTAQGRGGMSRRVRVGYWVPAQEKRSFAEGM
jgi:hypothetical protein